MARCLRCGAGNEWIEGKVPDEKPAENKKEVDYKQAWIDLRGQLERTKKSGFRRDTTYALIMMGEIEKELSLPAQKEE